MRSSACPFEITAEACRWASRYSRTGNGSGSVTAWPALLSPELLRAEVIDAIGPALTTELDLVWRQPPLPGRYDITVESVDDSGGPGGADRTYRSTFEDEGRWIARAQTTFRLQRSSGSMPGATFPGHLASARPAEPTTCWGRTISDSEINEYCAALGVPLAIGELFAWSGLSALPQPVLPASFLAAEALRVLGAPRAGHLQLGFRRPCVAGAALDWSRWDSDGGTRLAVRAVGAAGESWSAVFTPERPAG